MENAQALTGYLHSFDHSRFAVGKPGEEPTPVSEFGMSKMVGSWGVFAVVNATGACLASPNGDSPTLGAPRLSPASAHDAEVRDYFVGAGIEDAQILEVTAMSGSSYFSYLSRRAADVPVVDSYAWAELGADGSSVSESVFWPTIPEETMVAARDFSDKLKDPSSATGFPAGGRLVIHHTGTLHTPFETTVTYDVQSGNSTSHLDPSGQLVTLPGESSP